MKKKIRKNKFGWTEGNIIIDPESKRKRKVKSLKRMFKQGGSGSGNFDHEGRPGRVGGSAPDGRSPATKPVKAKKIDVRSSDGKPYKMVEDLSYERGLLLPNGKTAKRYIVNDLSGSSIGKITETSAYDDRKKTSSGVVLDRRDVVGYNAETFNERYPMWERSMHTINRSYAIDWLNSRRQK